ncbi:MAG: LpxI family protein [Alphaproteobacteria bacterium]|nr:LpxI family protein [Alphaproteobacteria bacterium]
MKPRLGVLAGGGPLPAAVVDAARAQGRDVFVLAFEGQTDPGWLGGVEHSWVRLGQFADAFARLRAAGVGEVCLIGPVRRPSLAELRPDWRAAQALARIGMRAFGDDGLLSAVVREIEGEGFGVVGAEEVLGALAARAGAYGRVAPSEQDREDIARGVAVLRALGAVDVGQAVVVERGVVLGVEAIEGTDALVARCAALRREPSGGVLVKIAKPAQERRVDLPTIGVHTVVAVAEAGFAGIAVEAGRTLVADAGAVAEAADARRIFVFGLVAT